MAKRTVIIDHGSGYLKTGLSGCHEPQMLVPNTVSYLPCKENPGPSHARRPLSVGIDSQYPNNFSFPVQRGRIINWEGVELLWSFVMQKYRQKQEYKDCPVLITESPFWEPRDRKKTLEIMFESLDVPSLLLADQLEMSLYASGLLSGVVVDCGFGLTRVQPFQLGQPLGSSGKTLELGGQDVTTYLRRSLFREKSDEYNLSQLETVSTIEKSKCYVPQNLADSLDLHHNLSTILDKSNTCRLPDGTKVELTPMQRVAPEMFFSPQVFDLPGPGISQAILDSVTSCEDSSRQILMSHVIPCGGNTMYHGFTKRLFKELTASPLSSTKGTALWVSHKRNYSVWLGASVVAHLSTYKSQWMTRAEYVEGTRL